MVGIITLKQQKSPQSDPVLTRQFSKKLQSDPLLIRPKLASVLIRAHLYQRRGCNSTISTDVRNFTEPNLQIKCNNLLYSSETEFKVAKKFKTSLSNPVQIHQKTENPPDINLNPSSLLLSSRDERTGNFFSPSPILIR